jgi:hypothetical protein
MPNIIIRQPCRIVCEGAADRSFFNSLIKAHKIPHCEAGCAHFDKDPYKCAGKNGITETLRGLKGYAEIEPGKLLGVVVAIDTDSDPKARLKETIESVKAADLKSPTKYLEPMPRTKEGEFSIAILGIPWHDKAGNLDLLLFEAMQITHADVIPALDTFCTQTQAHNGGWPIGPKAKMKLRCTIAATYRPDPGKSLSFLLSSSTNPIDLTRPEFNPIATFLSGFVTSVTAV